MARKPKPTLSNEPHASPTDQAFGAATAFIDQLGTLAYHARHFQSLPDQPDVWRKSAMTYAMAFVAWFDLSQLLTPAVRTEARRVYPPGSPAIRLGKMKPKPTVIEAVTDELGIYFRNTVYAGRQHPMEPDYARVADEARARATARQVAQGQPAKPLGWGEDYEELISEERAAVRSRLGLKTLGDCWMLMVDEWNKQDRKDGESALTLLRCGSIDFDDLRTQLIREAEAVIAAASKPSGPTIDPDLLARLQRAAAAVDPSAIDRAAERAAEKIARVFGAGDNGDAKPKTLPAGADESPSPALTVNQSRVLQTMARFDASRLLSSKMIAEEMDAMVRLSEETVRLCVVKLIESKLAERPEGDRSGARLNSAGRKLAGKIAD